MEFSSCNNRTEFRKKFPGAYVLLVKQKCLHESCQHMKRLGNLYNRCIYSYEFSDNYVYVGLTCNLKKRKKDRKNDEKDSVTIHIKNTGLDPIIKQLTEYISKDTASELEGYYVEEYKKSNWKILNKDKTGSLGGNFQIWTFEKCQQEALKYHTKKEFSTFSRKSYQAAMRNKWMIKITTHMVEYTKSKGYWNKETCLLESLKYDNVKDFMKCSITAYHVSSKNNWLEEFFINHKRRKKSITFDDCEKEALKYENKKDFIKNSWSIYVVSSKNKWLNDICLHMNKSKKKN